ncbi:MAG TPA: SdiA-regulated domain-containing protein [Ferruginibacter sp.]|nr:SdiA-regulated domain-containing protein [Ferruginibacter sp.]
MTFYRQFTCAVIIAGLFLACNNNNNKEKVRQNDTSRYDLLNPFVIKLPSILGEISGIYYYPKDTSVFAIEDEAGYFYKIYLERKGRIEKWQFSKREDFEDLALHDSVFYVLISNGDIKSVKFDQGDTIITNKTKFPKEGNKAYDFETMYYDDSLRQLILLCKDCEDEKNEVTAWGFDINTQSYTKGVFKIDALAIAQKTGKKKMKLKPSSAAINPVTNELYILASINKMIVVTDRKGKFISLYHLDPVIYKQPEGIAFTPAGDMIISNEWHESGLANILVIKNKKKGL